MLKGLKRWVELSPGLPDSERPHRLAMLDRAEASLDHWYDRSREDRVALEILGGRARAMPLSGPVIDSLRQPVLGRHRQVVGCWIVKGAMDRSTVVGRRDHAAMATPATSAQVANDWRRAERNLAA